MSEFFLQGDQEKANGLPVSPNMDRENTNENEVAIGFTDIIVKPFFDILSVIFPRIETLCLLLNSNSQMREFNSDPNLLMEIKEEFRSLAKKPSGIQNHRNSSIRKVSLAAGIIELPDSTLNHLRQSISGRVTYSRQRKSMQYSAHGSKRQSRFTNIESIRDSEEDIRRGSNLSFPESEELNSI